jgi:hypothetical protein
LQLAAKWLHDQQLAHFSEGRLCLLSDALASGVALSNPILSSSTIAEPSAWFLRDSLLCQGWILVDQVSEASIARQRAMRWQCKDYYKILYYFGDAALVYEEEAAFPHKGLVCFYQALCSAIVYLPDAANLVCWLTLRCFCCACVYVVF